MPDRYTAWPTALLFRAACPTPTLSVVVPTEPFPLVEGCVVWANTGS